MDTTAPGVSSPQFQPKQSLKEHLSGINWINWLLVAGFIAGAVFYFLPQPAGVNPNGWYALAILIPLIVIWATSAIPVGVGAVLYLALVVGFHLVSPAVAFRGFTSHLPWLLVGAFAMGSAMEKTGLSHRITYYLMARFKGLWGVIAAAYLGNICLAGVPSATARAAILAPVLNGIMTSIGRPKESNISRQLAFNFCHATNTLLGTMSLTGGAVNVTMMAVYTGTTGHSISWIGWITVMFFPTILYLVLGIAAAMFLEPPEPELAAKLRDSTAAQEAFDKLGLMKPSEWRVLALFLILIFLWVIGSWIKLDAGFAALIIMGVLFMPGVGVLQPKALREVNWDIALMIGSAVGVAGILNETGMIKVVADALISPVLNPLASFGTLGVAVGGIIVGLIAHFMLPGPANVTLAIPLLITWGTNIMHLPQIDVVVFLLFLSAMTSQIVAMAYQQPPYYVYLGMDVTNDARFNWLLIKVWPLHTAASIIAGYLIYAIVKATGIGLV